MPSVVAETLPVFVGLFGGAAICIPVTRCLPYRSLLVTAVYLSIGLELMVHAPRLPGTHWNWLGHILNLLLALTVIRVFRLSFREIGVTTLKGKGPWLFAGGLVAALLVGAINYIYRNHNPVYLETLLFEASLPGLAEEVAYRGITFALLCRDYEATSGDRSSLATITISAITFGLVHALSHGDSGWKFAWIPFGTALFLGIWCGFLRWRTSNVLVPAIAHNIGNCAGLWAGNL